MSWAALPVEPACMGKAVGEAGRPLMLCGARLYIITKSYTYDIDDNYWCATCGSHSHKEDSKTGYCWHCDTDSWVKEDGADVGI